MKTRWIVENFTHESSYMDLVKAIKKEGCGLQEIKKDFKFADLAGYDAESPVIFFGSIEMTKIVQTRLSHCFPVAYCNQENYLCSKYMTHYGKYLFNDRYAMMSLKELHRQKFAYFGMFAKEAMIFIRPDSGQKPFQAQLVDLLDFDNFVNQNEADWHNMVVISSPKNIRWEGRFIVSKYKDIISYSTYRFQGQTTRILSVPPKSLLLCKELLDVGYYPDSVFCLDLCEDNEINSFSSAGLYESDKTKIVGRVGEIAEEDWKNWKEKTTNT
jgi:hypothetical protein